MAVVPSKLTTAVSAVVLSSVSIKAYVMEGQLDKSDDQANGIVPIVPRFMM